jgi:hypothetical protein
MGHASRSSGLSHVEVSRVRIFQSGLKTGRGVMASGARDSIIEIVSGPN